MADAFISYRRKPSASLAMLLQEKLMNQNKVDGYLDTTRTDSTQVQFPERLMRAIEDAPVFICLLGDSTLESEWVLKEIRKAHQLNKFCIPVFQESYKAPENPEGAVLYLLNFDGVHIFDQKNIYIDTAVRDIANLIPRKASSFNWTRLFLGIVGILFFIGLATSGVLGLIQEASGIIISDWQTSQANVDEPLATETTPSPEAPGTNEEVLDPAIQLAIDGVSSNDEWTPVMREFEGIEMMLVPDGQFSMGSNDGFEDEQPIHNQTISPFWIDRYEVNNFQFAEFLSIYGNQSDEGFQYLDTDDPEQHAHIDLIQDIWQVEAGFENYPVVEVSWFAARDYCDWRDGYLLDEAQWEYAARGADSLIFPWGDVFVVANVTFIGNSNDQLDALDRRSNGISWIGAYDMSGNVWEWTSSFADDYPFIPNTSDVANFDRVRIMRGGSYQDDINFLRSANRGRSLPNVEGGNVGFRCARDFTE